MNKQLFNAAWKADPKVRIKEAFWLFTDRIADYQRFLEMFPFVGGGSRAEAAVRATRRATAACSKLVVALEGTNTIDGSRRSAQTTTRRPRSREIARRRQSESEPSETGQPWQAGR